MSGQSKIQSLIEAKVSTLAGFLIALVTTRYVLPLFGFDVTWSQSVGMVTIFTVISVIRSYFFRRLFNWIHLRSN